MKTFLTLILMATLTCSAVSQDAITGTLPDWEEGPGQVAVMSMGPPEVVGTFDAEGNFQIPLKPDYLDEVKQRMEAANSENTNGWTAELNTLEKRFSCTGEALEMVNADQPFTGFPAMGTFGIINMEGKKNYGFLMFVSSREFAKSLKPWKFQPGYYVQWYYVNEDARIQGECSITSYAMNQEETYEHRTRYDLDLEAGWNVIKYEIEQVFTDKEGNSYPMEESYSVLPQLPQDAEMAYFQE